MRTLTTIAFILILAVMQAYSQSKAAPVTAVSSVDLKKYSGVWYEIARYPNKFQDQCVGNTTATYTLKGTNEIEVLNKCTKKDGTATDAKGAGKIKDLSKPSKLKVRFAPGFLSFLPVVWADYWIIDLGPNYEYSAVGTPDRKYFWILSRTPEISDALYQQILRRAEAQGFEPGKVIKTPQNLKTLKGTVITTS